MPQRIVSARDQVEMLTPWLHEASSPRGGELYVLRDRDREVGKLFVATTTSGRYIADMWTDPSYRGRGIATALWRQAGCPPTTPGYQTPEGIRWAKKVGAPELRITRADLDDLKRAGIPLRTSAIEVPYLRNNNGMRQYYGPDDFEQKTEPWGRYMSHDSDPHTSLQSGWERGTVSFENPLMVPHEYGGWKQNLSEEFGGATGRQLSKALLDKGHDGVITHDKYGIGEIVDVRPKGQRGHQLAFTNRRVGGQESNPIAANPPYFYHYLPYQDDESTPQGASIEARLSRGTPVGSLAWYHQPGSDMHGQILSVQVDPIHRRHGIASDMLDAARQIEPAVHHSTALTPDGAAWARKKAMSEIYEEYAGHHKAPGPGTGFPVHDMTGDDYGGGLGGVPEDWYTHPHYYSQGETSPRETKRVQQLYNQVRGNPEAPVDVYRALPHGNTTFQTGDWVTPSLEYARQHAMHPDDPSQDWPVIKTTVPAKHLWQNGDSYYEFGYHGPKTPGTIHQ